MIPTYLPRPTLSTVFEDITSCKVCHGPLSPSHNDVELLGPSGCHEACLAFACPGCVAKNHATYNLLNMHKSESDYNCDECSNELVSPGPSKLISPGAGIKVGMVVGL
ncbi:hypothetical protein BCR39DRAFT_513387 [Naematelia encephala]|uniref:Uncharacterized protein n=1 Tax=Naematelia encephala TaxID=71784 RepID=A0A1Y2BIZ1_9TREE|nr:hypothetical protein BCR39DRAFT_513387 [Naematelia encephala]